MDILSPNISSSSSSDLNSSNNNHFLKPKSYPRYWSPFNSINAPKTPNLSPIVKPKTPASESAFLKRRDAKLVQAKIDEKNRRRTCLGAPQVKSPFNKVLEQTISVFATLKALNLSHLVEIFEKEEINTMALLFTLNNADLQMIGIKDVEDRKKILDFIASFNTPTKIKHHYRT